jgi:prepilin-type N-terminal cleavage/methylation domain-containing protein
MKTKKAQQGFTLMEIMVATVIFAVVTVSLLSLFNYVLKINRRGEALRQATQDSRDFVEFLVKEIRNGQIDYYVNNGLTYGSYINSDSPQAPCRPPMNPPGRSVAASDLPTYAQQSNWLGIINTDNVQECFYLGDQNGNYVNAIGEHNVANLVFTAPANSQYSLAMQKSGISTVQKLNPPNSRIDNLMFLVRPQVDPYSSTTPPTTMSPSGGLAKVQPFVVILVKFVVQLPTGEQVPIYYQTAVSENKYDIPNQ